MKPTVLSFGMKRRVLTALHDRLEVLPIRFRKTDLALSRRGVASFDKSCGCFRLTQVGMTVKRLLEAETK
jgi:hypothetical protein